MTFCAIILITSLYLPGQSTMQVVDLKGIGHAPVISTSSGTLTRSNSYVQIIANSDFQAWNYNGEYEENTQQHMLWGLFGNIGDSHFFVADLDFPLGARLDQIALYGLDLSESRSLRFRLYQQNRVDGSLKILFEDFSKNTGVLPGSELTSEILAVDIASSIRLDNSVSTYFIDIAPVFDQDKQANTGSPWPGIGLDVRNVLLTYKYN